MESTSSDSGEDESSSRSGNSSGGGSEVEEEEKVEEESSSSYASESGSDDDESESEVWRKASKLWMFFVFCFFFEREICLTPPPDQNAQCDPHLPFKIIPTSRFNELSRVPWFGRKSPS